MSYDNRDFNLLIEECKSGSQCAYNELYQRCSGYIAFVCSKIHDDKQDIEEIVQDTFLYVFGKVDELRGETLIALLRKVAINKCYSKHRSRKKHMYNVGFDEGIDPDIIDLDPNFLPEVYLQNKEFQAEVMDMVNALPPRQRELIYLYYYADMKTEEIAALYNCPGVNIRKTLHVARNTLRNYLEKRRETTDMQRMAGVSFVSALILEEVAFVSSYTAAGMTAATVAASNATASATATSTTVATSTSTSGIIAVTVGIVATCVIAAAAVLAHTSVDEMPIMTALPDVENITIPEVYEEDKPEYIEPLSTEPAPRETVPPESIVLPPPTTEPEVTLPPPVAAETTPYVPQVHNQVPEPEPNPPAEYVITYEPELPEVTEEPEAPEEPTEPEPEPPVIDRTAEILAALASASNSDMLNNVLAYYGFNSTDQLRDSTNLLFGFYILQINGGNILVGTSAYEDGTYWQMKFEYFIGYSQVPAHTSDLIRWLEG